MWCENIKIVQDDLSLWPSREFNVFIILGSNGFLILITTLLYEKWNEGNWTDIMWNKGSWTGVIMIFFCLFGFERLSVRTERAANVFMSEQKIELIGDVSDLEIELNDRSHTFGASSHYTETATTSGPISYDAIRRDPQMFLGNYKLSARIPMVMGGNHSHFSPRPADGIWYKVDGRLIKSNVMTVGFNPGNECDGRKCGLRSGDQVRISLTKETLLKKRPIIRNIDNYGRPLRKLEYRDYYSETLRIERCDDEMHMASSH